MQHSQLCGFSSNVWHNTVVWNFNNVTERDPTTPLNLYRKWYYNWIIHWQWKTIDKRTNSSFTFTTEYNIIVIKTLWYEFYYDPFMLLIVNC